MFIAVHIYSLKNTKKYTKNFSHNRQAPCSSQGGGTIPQDFPVSVHLPQATVVSTVNTQTFTLYNHST